MSEYISKTWETGDIITAEDLNNLEGGVETAISKIVVITGTYALVEGGSSITLNKTFKEIEEMVKTSAVFVNVDYTTTEHAQYYIALVENSSERHIVLIVGDTSIQFIGESENEYPVNIQFD